MSALAVAYLCVLACALMPYVWVGIAKAGGARYDNRDPRGWLAKQDSARVRSATSAHLNSFEAFAPFAAGVVIAQLAGVAESTIATLAVVFVVARIAYGVCYLTGAATVRSLTWMVGIAAMVALFVLAIMRVA